MGLGRVDLSRFRFPDSLPPVEPRPEATLDAYIANWLAEVGSRSPLTGAAYRRALRRSGEDVTALGLRRLTPGQAARLYDTWCTRWSLATANQTIAVWSRFWEAMLRDGAPLPPNPWKGLRRRNPPQQIPQRVLTREEVAWLIHACDPGLPETLARFLYATGARISEATRLTWADVHRGPDGIMVATLYGKGGKTRYVRIRPKVWAAMQALPGPHRPTDRIFPVSRTNAWNWLHRAAQRAGLGDRIVSPHVLRHSHATHAIEAGANVFEVQATLGHARLDTTQIYVNLQPGPRSEAYLDDP